MLSSSIRLVAAVILGCCLAAGLAAQQPPAYFEQNCAGCHTIGGGNMAGPDLKDVTRQASRKWLIDFIHNPEAKVKAGDPLAKRMVEEAGGFVMPGFPDVPDTSCDQLLTWIEKQSATAPAAPTASEPPASDSEIALGRDLFLGYRRLANGGTACVACHQASGTTNGGRLGPDLSLVYRKLGGQHGLSAWLSKPVTPVMASVFRLRPLSTEEASDLAAFFGRVGENSAQLRQSPTLAVQLSGLGGSLLGIGLIALIWRGRLRGVRGLVTAKRGAK